MEVDASIAEAEIFASTHAWPSSADMPLSGADVMGEIHVGA